MPGAAMDTFLKDLLHEKLVASKAAITIVADNAVTTHQESSARQRPRRSSSGKEETILYRATQRSEEAKAFGALHIEARWSASSSLKPTTTAPVASRPSAASTASSSLGRTVGEASRWTSDSSKPLDEAVAIRWNNGEDDQRSRFMASLPRRSASELLLSNSLHGQQKAGAGKHRRRSASNESSRRQRSSKRACARPATAESPLLRQQEPSDCGYYALLRRSLRSDPHFEVEGFALRKRARAFLPPLPPPSSQKHGLRLPQSHRYPELPKDLRLPRAVLSTTSVLGDGSDKTSAILGYALDLLE